MSQDDAEIVEEEDEMWKELTVMQGPDVSGRQRISFGRADTWEKMDEEGDVYVAAEPIEIIPLPRAMTREEIESWLEAGDWGEQILEQYDSTDSDPRLDATG